MNTTVPWYTSKTIWGALLAIVSALLPVINHNWQLLPADQETLANALGAIGAAAGGVLSIIGRVTATGTIGTPPS